MEKLTVARMQYLRGITILLVLQLVIVLVVVAVMRQVAPDAVCMATCNLFVDLIIFVLLIVGLIWASWSRRFPTQLRYVAFFLVPVVLAYLFAIPYNIMATRDKKLTSSKFVRAVVLIVFLLSLTLFLMPYAVHHPRYILFVSLPVWLMGLISWGFLIGKDSLMWVAVGLFVFIGLLTMDMRRLVVRCHKTKTAQCEPLNGASLLYADMANTINHTIKLFALPNRRFSFSK
jgi:hypothetical protein